MEKDAATVAERGAAWGNSFGVAHNPKYLKTPGLFLAEIGSTAVLLFASVRRGSGRGDAAAGNLDLPPPVEAPPRPTT